MKMVLAAVGLGDFFLVALWPKVGHVFLIHEVSRSHTQQRTTVGRTPLDEWPARRRDLYLKTHNTNKRKTSIPPAGLEPTVSAGKRPQNDPLGRAATGNRTICLALFLHEFWLAAADEFLHSDLREWNTV
jgi:hypothetical protein